VRVVQRKAGKDTREGSRVDVTTQKKSLVPPGEEPDQIDSIGVRTLSTYSA
jgi:hypothetical protein